MSTATFALADLMDLLAKVGLPASERTDDPAVTITDLGLDSLAFLQLQTLLQERHGLTIDEDEQAGDLPVGHIVDLVNDVADVNGTRPEVPQP